MYACKNKLNDRTLIKYFNSYNNLKLNNSKFCFIFCENKENNYKMFEINLISLISQIGHVTSIKKSKMYLCVSASVHMHPI